MDAPAPEPQPIIAPERSVVLPLSEYSRMAFCYYGGGPDILGRTRSGDPPRSDQALGVSTLQGGGEGRLAPPYAPVTVASNPQIGGKFKPRGWAAERLGLNPDGSPKDSPPVKFAEGSIKE